MGVRRSLLFVAQRHQEKNEACPFHLAMLRENRTMSFPPTTYQHYHLLWTAGESAAFHPAPTHSLFALCHPLIESAVALGLTTHVNRHKKKPSYCQANRLTKSRNVNRVNGAYEREDGFSRAMRRERPACLRKRDSQGTCTGQRASASSRLLPSACHHA